MKKSVISVLLLAAAIATHAQQVTVAEPEFVNSYCILTSDSTYAILPKENGTIGKHQSKVSRWSKVAGGMSRVASAAGHIGMLGAASGGNVSGVLAGAKVMSSAGGISTIASTASSLAGCSGMDIVFSGAGSSYTCNPDGQDIRLLIKAEKNDNDPMDVYRIVRFTGSKKDRRIQWMEIQPSLLGTSDAKKAGYVYFTAHKYGEQSYLITIPAEALEEGEYGIFYMNIASASVIPVGTFGVK